MALLAKADSNSKACDLGHESTANFTQKQWVVPPRPKPGRKPAGEMPPTKRKAQNREAQRAFRERRAARVGELQEQLRDVEGDRRQEHEALLQRVAQLEGEVSQYRQLLLSWQAKYALLSQRESQRERRQDDRAQEEDLTCGRCDGSDRCQCIEEAFELSEATKGGTEKAKMSHAQPGILEHMETDFTTSFAAQPDVPSTIKPCGFCSNGNVCICAAIDSEPKHKSQQMIVPDTRTVSCSGNPGSCAQCQTNPTSTLFCKTLASARDASPSGAQKSGHGPTLSCADAFTTLSRHRAFPQASVDLGSWVSQLTAVSDSGAGSARAEGKTAFEIEAASVMSVLRFFDNRFSSHD